MTGENSLRIKRGLIVLISIMLAAHRGLYHARVRSLSASPSTWHTVPVSFLHGTAGAYITPLEGWIIQISHSSLGLAIRLAALVPEVRKQKKSFG
jgi:hypothetical protein